jgi:hypothetical protein
MKIQGLTPAETSAFLKQMEQTYQNIEQQGIDAQKAADKAAQEEQDS